jgi:hypothetical protein
MTLVASTARTAQLYARSWSAHPTRPAASRDLAALGCSPGHGAEEVTTAPVHPSFKEVGDEEPTVDALESEQVEQFPLDASSSTHQFMCYLRLWVSHCPGGLLLSTSPLSEWNQHERRHASLLI